MEIREAREGDVVVLVPDASVTGNDETRAIEAKLEATIKAGAKLLVVDCGAIKQLTSAAVRVLLAVSAVDDAAAELGWGARRLHRQITTACGYSPKLLHRVLRLQRAIRIAHAGQRSLASLAAAAGYADQAHMTREFTALTDLPPARYLALADPRVGRWLVSDLFKTSAIRGAMLCA